MFGRLLERLEEGVGGGAAHVVCLLDDVGLAAGAHRRQGAVAHHLADLLDQVARRGGGLEDAQVGVGSPQGCLELPAIPLREHGGRQARSDVLAAAAGRACKQVCVGDATLLQGPLQVAQGLGAGQPLEGIEHQQGPLVSSRTRRRAAVMAGTPHL